MTQWRAFVVGLGAFAIGLCVLEIAVNAAWTRAADPDKAPPSGRVEVKDPGCIAMRIGDKTLWQFNFKKEEGKPYFHPVCTADGTCLTWLRPADHRWHRAIWFSWKYLNKLNYWEENRQGLSQGRTEVITATCTQTAGGPANLAVELAYHPPEKPAVLKERRTIRISLPDKDGRYRMDWQSVFAAQDQEVLLDRTKIKAEGGPAWGGYAGLSYRAAETMRQYQVLNSEGLKDMAAHGKHARWMDFSGVVDAKTGKAAGVAMFDHPANPRHPTPWYVAARGKFGYFGPALLFDKPLRLAAGKTLKLTYRILIHPGRGQKEQLEKEYKDFAGEAGKGK